MTFQQQQAYYLYQRQRQQAMYHYAQNTYYIQNIRSLMNMGINPADVPEVRDVYWALINEYGDIFQFEDRKNDAILTKEEEKR